MRLSEIDAIPCPVARALSVIGDAWTILILRDCLRGQTRFEAFAASTRAPRAVLSARLAQLVDAGLLDRAPYGEHSRRFDYTLTERGRALQPVLMMLSHWSQTWLPDPDIRRIERRHTTCGHLFTPVVTCSECGDATTPDTVVVESGPRQAIPARAKPPEKTEKKLTHPRL